MVAVGALPASSVNALADTVSCGAGCPRSVEALETDRKLEYPELTELRPRLKGDKPVLDRNGQPLFICVCDKCGCAPADHPTLKEREAAAKEREAAAEEAKEKAKAQGAHLQP